MIPMDRPTAFFLIGVVLGCFAFPLWKRNTIPSLLAALVLALTAVAALLVSLGYIVLGEAS